MQMSRQKAAVYYRVDGSDQCHYVVHNIDGKNNLRKLRTGDFKTIMCVFVLHQVLVE